MAEGVNPKDLIGATKVDLALVPGTALVAEALAMTDGGLKYGPYNWREQGKPVQAMTYASAALRHLHAWIDGENESDDALVHHLAHVRACCGIIIDAQTCGQLVDNRPPKGATPKLLKAGQPVIARLVANAKERLAKLAGGGP